MGRKIIIWAAIRFGNFAAVYIKEPGKPYIIAGASMFCGYVWAWLTNMEKVIDKDLETFHRKEQMGRLKRMIGLR